MSTAGPGETPDLLTIGELARWADVAPATLRHYEDLGLLDAVGPVGPVERAEPIADQRRYAASAVGLVDVIVLLEAVGFSPRETRELLDARSGSPRSWRQLAERKVAALEQQVRAARTALDALDHALRCEHDGIVDCPRFRALVADHRADGAPHPAGRDGHGPTAAPRPEELEQPATSSDPLSP